MKQDDSEVNNGTGILSKKEKFSYGLGDLGFNLSYQGVMIYLLYFYTDVFGITAAAAGLILVLSRVWDAVSDPVMGYLADHTNSKRGRFRPFLLFGALPLGITMILTFSTPELSQTGKFIYALVTFILYTTAYTITNIPYSALTSAITQDTNERTTLSSLRMIFGAVGVAIVTVATLPLVNLFSNERLGFQMVTMLYALLAVALLLTTYFNVRERAVPPRENRYKIKTIFSIIGKNKPLLVLAAANFFYSLSHAIRLSAILYYLKYNLGREDLTPLIFGVLFLVMIVGAALVGPAVKRFGKRNVYLWGSLASIGGVSIYFIPYDQLTTLLVIFAIGGFLNAGPMVCSWAMIPDTVDYSQWKTGERADGVIYAFHFFCLKTALAAAGALAGFVLSNTGYEANVEQTPQALEGILHMVSTIPAVLSIFMVLFIYFYRLDSGLFKRIISELGSTK